MRITNVMKRFALVPRWVKIYTTFVVVLLFGGVISAYETYENIPNPIWGTLNGSFSYSVANGPPSDQLFEVRPDDVVRQYITDYIAIAGTYPCAQDISQYSEAYGDSIWAIRACQVRRPVKKIQFGKVDVQLHCRIFGTDCFMVVIVHLTISYSNGQVWQYNNEVFPFHQVAYYRTFIHLSCWNLATYFYTRINSHVPKGILYIDASNQQYCS